jgi:hypothetical protein
MVYYVNIIIYIAFYMSDQLAFDVSVNKLETLDIDYSRT